jgi:lambda family phage portal protein
MKRDNLPAVVPTENALGGGIEGAERHSRELFSWQPQVISPDQQINLVKDLADARGRDVVQNDGYATGAIQTHRDSIVGSQFRLNAQPDYELLGEDEGWADEFQKAVESRFNLLADSQECWLDASGKMTFTGMLRLVVGGFLMTGEALATVEWKREQRRPFSTAIQMVAPARLSNPDGRMDDRFLRRGIERNIFGEAQRYWIRVSHPSEFWDPNYLAWKPVDARKPWGRRQVLHIIDPLQPDQTRGIADMVSALKNMRMTKRFQDVTLQNAVVNASYAAAIESELPKEMVFGSMGAGGNGLATMLGEYMTALGAYSAGANNIAVDGVKMPHLFPGTKLSLKPMGTPGGVGTDFEQSLLRHTAAALGMSYEQFSKDYTKTNYSSARASMGETWKYMQSRKKVVADAFASMVYMLVLEEWVAAGEIPLPRSMRNGEFWTSPLLREALGSCDWIGASRGQIDEKKETEAAILRIEKGLSTYEEECARLGKDFRKVFKQRSREQKMLKDLDLDFSDKPAAAAAAQPGDKTDNQDGADQ